MQNASSDRSKSRTSSSSKGSLGPIILPSLILQHPAKDRLRHHASMRGLTSFGRAEDEDLGDRADSRRSAIVAALAVIIPACGPASDDGVSPASRASSRRALGTTRGPNGEPPTPNSALRLSSSEVAKVRAVADGARTHRHEARTSPMPSTPACASRSASGSGWSPRRRELHAAKRRPTSRRSSRQAAVGLVDASRRSRRDRIGVQAAARRGDQDRAAVQRPGEGQGRDYVNLVTDDLFQMGKRAADALAAAIGNGKIAYFGHDGQPLRLNQRDQAFPEHDHRQLPGDRRGREARNRRSEPSARCCRHHAGNIPTSPVASFAQPPGEACSRRSAPPSIDEAGHAGSRRAAGARHGQGRADVRADRRPRADLGQAMARSAAYALLGKGSAVRDAGADHHEVESRPGLSRIAAPQPAYERHEGARW